MEVLFSSPQWTSPRGILTCNKRYTREQQTCLTQHVQNVKSSIINKCVKRVLEHFMSYRMAKFVTWKLKTEFAVTFRVRIWINNNNFWPVDRTLVLSIRYSIHWQNLLRLLTKRCAQVLLLKTYIIHIWINHKIAMRIVLEPSVKNLSHHT